MNLFLMIKDIAKENFWSYLFNLRRTLPAYQLKRGAVIGKHGQLQWQKYCGY